MHHCTELILRFVVAFPSPLKHGCCSRSGGGSTRSSCKGNRLRDADLDIAGCGRSGNGDMDLVRCIRRLAAEAGRESLISISFSIPRLWLLGWRKLAAGCSVILLALSSVMWLPMVLMDGERIDLLAKDFRIMASRCSSASCIWSSAVNLRLLLNSFGPRQGSRNRASSNCRFSMRRFEKEIKTSAMHDPRAKSAATAATMIHGRVEFLSLLLLLLSFAVEARLAYCET